MAVPLYQAKAELFRTLGHPARIRILELLSERDHPVHELLESIEIEQSNLSQQLAVLRRAGLVSQRREAGAVVYALSVPGVAELLRTARRLLSDVLDDQGALKAELERSAQPAPARPTRPQPTSAQRTSAPPTQTPSAPAGTATAAAART
ncbi:MAG: metalloregulator ArsR/SmtB family transcription factor [Actinobacteria bacterium]|nr:metalloregulator ArsR/SmtB family transcription factor [Actinomycetota bacterium]MCG2802683.1 metalloregulator ArsR/SmtB family transcription factor [Cellulomonas sp.]